MHGHSRNRNIFIYGNTDNNSPSQYKIFPFILSKICPFFSFNHCRFSVHQSKFETARVTFWNELHIQNIFTVEASFFGPDKQNVSENPNNNYINQLHFNQKDYMEVG